MTKERKLVPTFYEDCIDREQAKKEIGKAFSSLESRAKVSSILNGLPNARPVQNISVLKKIRAELLLIEGMEDAIEVIDKYMV